MCRACRWMEALNEGDLDAFDNLATSDYVYHGSGVELQGVSELKAFLREVHAAFSDLHFTTERMVFEGDLGAMQFTMHGHQRLPFLGIPSRGNPLDLSFQVISRFRDGKIAEDWEVFDAAEMRRQLETPAVSAV